MGSYHTRILRHVRQDALHKFMRHRMGEEDQHIRFSDPVLHIGLRLAEYLGLPAVAGTHLTVPSLHTFISAYDYQAHNDLLSETCSATAVRVI